MLKLSPHALAITLPLLAAAPSLAADGRYASVWGFTWQPEKLFASAAACAPACPPPMLLKVNPHFQAAVSGESQVELRSADGSQVHKAAALRAEEGSWKIDRLPAQRGATWYVDASGPKGTLPTRTLRPVVPNHAVCAFQQAALLSEGEVLAAVAAHLTANGQPTTPADFLDPARFAAVALVAVYQPETGFIIPLAEQAKVTATGGTVLQVAHQKKGTPAFAVVPKSSASPSGLSVVLVPAEAAQKPVTITAEDGRPKPGPPGQWKSASIDVAAAPGHVLYVPLRLQHARDPEADSVAPGLPFESVRWLCSL